MSKQTQVRENFFAEKNEQMLDRLLYDDIQRRTGAPLDETQKLRLVKTVKHYMSEVYRVNMNQPIQVLNKEVLTATVPDYMAYIRRKVESEQSEQTEVEIVNSVSDPLRTDTGTRFALMQDSRNEGKAKPPAPPDFRIPLDSEDKTAVDLFEQVKKVREAEAARVEAARPLIEKQPQAMSMESGLVERPRPMPVSAGAAPRPRILENQIPEMNVPPDMRQLLFGSDTYRQERNGLAQANPTIAIPAARVQQPVLQQDFIQKQDDIVNYKENEFNLFCYSADRDWTVATGENRYSFSVSFNPGNVVGNNSLRPNTSTQVKFRNIVRIELVKALIPVEGIDTLVDKVTDNLTYQTNVNTNALSFPYLMVRVPELETNNVGTSSYIDNAFGLIQYDANWITDNTNVSQRGGFLGMIPKFMKCQKIYYPTPLATLQRLTIQLQRPDGTLLSAVPDTLSISGFILSNALQFDTTTTLYTNTVDKRNDGSSDYIWIQTSTYFSTFMFNKGDRIQLKNVAFTSAFTGNTAVTADFISFLTDSAGLLVVNIGYINGANLTTGYNTVGYANYIIVEARRVDPTTGGVDVIPFGGVATEAFSVALTSGISMSNVSAGSASASSSLTPRPVIKSGSLINLSHQTQVVFRVITRDMDAASRLRPDNLN
jgi:hypothetical protein